MLLLTLKTYCKSILEEIGFRPQVFVVVVVGCWLWLLLVYKSIESILNYQEWDLLKSGEQAVNEADVWQ